MEICYDESFWEEFEILMFDRDRMGQTTEDVEDIIKLMGIRPGERLLDVCCGFGRHSQIFASKDVNTTGIDITEYYLKRANKERVSLDNPHFILTDILEYEDTETYNYAINMFTSFGLLNSEDDEIKALKNVYNSLKRGGKYLIDIQGKELLCRDYEKNIWFESGDVKVFLEYNILESFTLLNSRWLYYTDNKMHERSFNTRIYSALELAAMVSGVGFETVEIYGDLKGNPYDIYAKRLIVVGTK